jgi:hypothetical protein
MKITPKMIFAARALQSCNNGTWNSPHNIAETVRKQGLCASDQQVFQWLDLLSTIELLDSMIGANSALFKCNSLTDELIRRDGGKCSILS